MLHAGNKEAHPVSVYFREYCLFVYYHSILRFLDNDEQLLVLSLSCL